MNAFNMPDGINGLCSGCNACFNAYGFLLRINLDSMLVLIIGSMIGFVLFNLGVFKKKSVFGR